MHWKCPNCKAIRLIDGRLDYGEYQDCKKCGEVVQPHKFVATWKDFWELCEKRKKDERAS